MDAFPADSGSTRSLLRQASAGDRKAFEQLFALHRPSLRRAVARRLDPKLRARVDPSDVVQDTQLEAFRRLADYLERRPMPFRLWLWKTALQRLLKVQRRHIETARRAVGREIMQPDPLSLPLNQQLPAVSPTPSQDLAGAERAHRVREGLKQLAQSDREIVIMRTFDGFSFEEVACLLDIDPAAARKHYGRALLKLHQVLLKNGLRESAL
ncbi:MAG: sigma-70 family RNA polymerase sigma factor [Gemmataceae bacterium]